MKIYLLNDRVQHKFTIDPSPQQSLDKVFLIVIIHIIESKMEINTICGLSFWRIRNNMIISYPHHNAAMWKIEYVIKYRTRTLLLTTSLRASDSRSMLMQLGSYKSGLGESIIIGNHMNGNLKRFLLGFIIKRVCLMSTKFISLRFD